MSEKVSSQISPALIQVESLSFNYGESYQALNDISVSFEAGELVAVLGSNGAGKSTFFLCCNGVLQPQQGHISYRGEKLTHSKKDLLTLRQGVGLVFQDPDSQIIAGKVESEVSFGPMNLRLSTDEVKQRVDEALEQMSISRYRDFAPQYLSGGEKKRVSIADILAMRPAMIMLDEPTASLDPENCDALELVLRKLNDAGITIVISTHDVDFAYRIAERVIVFSQGSIIADEHVGKVFENEDVLKQAGLKKPLLYEAFEALVSSNSALATCSTDTWPRTINDFKTFFNAHSTQAPSGC